MLPSNRPSVFPVPGVLMAPDDLRTRDLEDFEQGGVAIQDTSEGLTAYRWRMWLNGIDVMLQREGADPLVLFQASRVAELTFAFDQNMRPASAYRDDSGEVFLRWFDSQAVTYRTDSFGVLRNPRLTLDDKRMSQIGNSDIIFAYIRGNGLYYRQQRDRYTIERLLQSGISSEIKLRNVGMTDGLRLQFDLA